MLGYINRYLGTATVIRNFKKDYDSGYKHTRIVDQLEVLKKRIELSRYMLTAGVTSLVFACLSMFFIFIEWQTIGEMAFGLSIVVMIISLFISLTETSLSNKSLFVEIEDIITRESK